MSRAILRPVVPGLLILIMLFLVAVGPASGEAAIQPNGVMKPSPDMPFPPPLASFEADAAQVSDTDITDSLGEWSKITYQSFRDGNWEIYLADGNGNHAQNLSRHPGADARPRLNRGATQVVFNSNRDGNVEVYSIGTDGSGLKRLTHDPAIDFAPAWSPDGSKVAFVSDRTGNNEIFVMNADGSGQKQLTYDPASDTGPAWSPDGTTVAWRKATGNLGAVWLMSPDGSNPRLQMDSLRYLGSPSWSPDGASLLADADIDLDEWNELIQINFGGGRTGVYDAQEERVDIWAGSYSPDGHWAIFSRVEYELVGNQLQVRRTYLQRIELGSGPTARLPGTGAELNPDWVTADILAPQSQVTPLGEYLPAGRVPVEWSGTDYGPSGIAGFDVQYRLSPSRTWVEWRSNVTSTKADLFHDQPGAIVQFRARARDVAGNVEAWPANPDVDASTRLYKRRVEGQIKDDRAIPLPAVAWSISPPPIDDTRVDRMGRYQAFLAKDGRHIFNADQPGYGSFPAAQLSINSEAEVNLYLPPQANLVQNGSFESGTSGWVTEGATEQNTESCAGHTGDNSLAMGHACPWPCLSPGITLPGVLSYNMAVDPDGNLHGIVQVWRESGPLFLHSWRAPNGQWSTPTPIGSAPVSSSGYQPTLAIDVLGTIHFIVETDAGLEYAQKPAAGVWTPLALFGANCRDHAMAVDAHGGVHTICLSNSGIAYRERTPDGTWRTHGSLGTGDAYYGAALAIGPDNTLHFLWQEESRGMFYRSRLPGGTMTEEVQLFAGSGYSHSAQRIAVGPNGEVHAFWVWQREGYYAFRHPNGTWEAAMVLPETYGEAIMATDGQGRLHMVGDWNGGCYRLKEPGVGWSVLRRSLFRQYMSFGLAVARSGTLYLLYQDSGKQVFKESMAASEPALSLAEQRISLPAGIAHPTLAFFHKSVSGDPHGSSTMQVNIADAAAETAMVYTATAGAEWTQGWVDLQAWSGREITVTFMISQSANEPYLQTCLDDVAVGEWATPVVTEVNPSRLFTDWDGIQLTVKGDNFGAKPGVLLDETPLANVKRIDEQTLSATLPTGLLSGSYDLWVINPGRQRNVLPDAVTLGQYIYLPVIVK